MNREKTTEDRLARWREDTPGCAHRVHLNNAGSALMPRSVLEAQRTHLDREGEIGGYEAADEAATRVEEAYQSVASLLGAGRENVAFVENATVAYFQALSAVDFRSGDVIVTTRNDYISNQISFLSLAQRFGVQVRRAADLPSGGCDPESVRSLLKDPSVKLLSVTWIPTNSGLVQPVEELGAIAEAAGVPYLIDGCQAVGQFPIDVKALKCDFLSATARKFLRGPRGIGFLFVSDRALARGAHPLFLDMRGAQWVSADSYELAKDARRFENWEYAYSLVLGLGEAARYAAEVGVAAGGSRARALAANVRDHFHSLPGFRVLDRGDVLAATVTLEVSGWESPKLVERLRAEGINTSATLRAYAVIDMDEKHASSALRVSPHYYNTEEEIGTFVQALEALARR